MRVMKFQSCNIVQECTRYDKTEKYQKKHTRLHKNEVDIRSSAIDVSHGRACKRQKDNAGHDAATVCSFPSDAGER